MSKKHTKVPVEYCTVHHGTRPQNAYWTSCVSIEMLAHLGGAPCEFVPLYRKATKK